MARILLVDDEPMLRSMIEFALRQEGISVMTAGSAAEAISAARSRPQEIDLLITEVRVPGMNGVDLATRLADEDPAMRVLLLSGSLEEIPEGASRRFEFLPKPFPLNEFLTQVRRLLCSVAAPSFN